MRRENGIFLTLERSYKHNDQSELPFMAIKYMTGSNYERIILTSQYIIQKDFSRCLLGNYQWIVYF